MSSLLSVKARIEHRSLFSPALVVCIYSQQDGNAQVQECSQAEDWQNMGYLLLSHDPLA